MVSPEIEINILKDEDHDLRSWSVNRDGESLLNINSKNKNRVKIGKGVIIKKISKNVFLIKSEKTAVRFVVGESDITELEVFSNLIGIYYNCQKLGGSGNGR